MLALTQPLNKPTRSSLALNIAVAVGSTVLVNGLIFGLGWNTSTDYAASPAFAPPDWVVGVVWTVVLFPLMAVARWRLNSSVDPQSQNAANQSAKNAQARAWVTALLVACLIWPFFTLALGSLIGGLIGNGAVILLAALTARRIWPLSKLTAVLVMPVIAWVTFATFIIAGQFGWL